MNKKVAKILITSCLVYLFILQSSSTVFSSGVDTQKINTQYNPNNLNIEKDHAANQYLDPINYNSKSQSASSYTASSESFQNFRYPIKQHLKIDGDICSSQSVLGEGVKLAVSVTPSTTVLRGGTITVSGQLKSSLPGDYWNGETVKLYYNVTETEFVNNKTFYENNPAYYVGSDITSGQGDFSIDLSTSTFSSDHFSKIGEITLLTWFDGNPSKGRAAGSPGSEVVTFYAGMYIDVVSSVSNPNSTYSFTTQVKFDNGTVVPTAGTSYHLTVTWSSVGVHTDTNYTFSGSPPSHDYSNTAPLTVDTVTYEAYYDITQLSFSTTYFAENGTNNPATDKLIYLTFQDQTEQQVLADAYFISGGSLTKLPIEKALDSYVTFYANLSDENGILVDENITVSFRLNNVEYESLDYTTNSSGAIQFSYYLNHSLFTDIRETFTIVFRPNDANYSSSNRTSTTLTCYLAVNITTINVSITDSSIFYTPGQSIEYTVTVFDEFGRQAPGGSFQVQFPGLAPQDYIASNSGTRVITTTVPDYAGVDQTQNKTIIVLAQNYDGGTYKYIVNGTVQNTVLFDIYFALSMTLLDPNNAVVTDGSTRTVFNNTFYSEFTTGSYNLSVVDQWGRVPLGAAISITFNGYTASHFVNSTVNWVLFDLNALEQSGLNLSEAHAGLSLIAHSGAYTYQSEIQQTINIYGPDNTAPTILTVSLSPDPFIGTSHEPYFNVTFSVVATDVGTGIRQVVIWYDLTSPDNSTSIGWQSVTCILNGTNLYVGTISVTTAFSQWYVYTYIVAKDYAGWGLNESGLRQETPQYDADFGLEDYWHSENDPLIYQIGDYVPPTEERVPDINTSPDPSQPYVNITVYVNDSLIYSGVDYVEIVINATNVATGVLENTIVDNMTNIPGTNQWFYLLNMSYNYNYTWYYIAYDKALPTPNAYKGPLRAVESIDDITPIVSNYGVFYNGTRVNYNDTLLFYAQAVDYESGLQNLTLIINYLDNEYRFLMIYNDTSGRFEYILDLSQYPPDTYGTFELRYTLRAYDNVNNTIPTTPQSLPVYNPSPIIPPGGGTSANIGAIVGGSVAGVIVILIGLFVWYYRHSITTYARRQTLRRKLQDYLRDILAEIKQDGINGRYKDGLLKTWRVVEGIGREFFELPRYKFQTPLEFGVLLAEKSNIDKQLMFTIVRYFEKARYGHEKITENDYNAGVQALYNIIARIEVGEMEIES